MGFLHFMNFSPRIISAPFLGSFAENILALTRAYKSKKQFAKVIFKFVYFVNRAHTVPMQLHPIYTGKADLID